MTRAGQAAPTIDPHAYERRWKILVVLCASLTVIMVANGSLNVAIPQLAESLHASTSALQWMVDAYALVFAGMLFTGGTLGDRFGRRRALQFGLTLFLAGTTFASFAGTAGAVIAARALMGFAAAFVMPSTLSLLANVFPVEERAKAISVWAGVAAGGAALGPPISGLLVEHFWWGSVFLVNVPLLVGAIIAGRILLPESRDPRGERVDIAGALLSIVAIGVLVFAIIEAPARGWASGRTLATFAISIIALAAFVWRERITDHPMFDLRLLSDTRFSVATIGIGLCFFAMFGTWFLLTQYLQLVLGYSPFGAGLLLLPMSLIMVAVAPQAPRLVGRFGLTRVAGAGMGSIAIGLVMLSVLGPHTPGPALYLSMVPMMVGAAATMSPLTTLIMAAVPPERAGVGSATNDTTRELGGALGVAVLGSIVNTRFGHLLDGVLGGFAPVEQAMARTGLPGALKVAAAAPGAAGRALADAARVGFTEAMGTASLVGAVVVIVAAIASTVRLRRVLPSPPPLLRPTVAGDAEAEPLAG